MKKPFRRRRNVVISRVRQRAQYAEMRRNGRRVVTLRARCRNARTVRFGRSGDVVFIGSEAAQAKFFRGEPVAAEVSVKPREGGS